MERTFKDNNLQTCADMPPIGSKWHHTGNKHTYTVIEHVFNGDSDTWEIVLERAGSEVHFTRSFRSFNSKRENGDKRFVRIAG